MILYCLTNLWRKKVTPYNVNKYLNSLYLRFEVKDKPGVLSQITKQLALKGISVARLIQMPNHKQKTASIVIITHKSNELDAQICLKLFKSNKNIIKSPTLIRLIWLIIFINEKNIKLFFYIYFYNYNSGVNKLYSL